VGGRANKYANNLVQGGICALLCAFWRRRLQQKHSITATLQRKKGEGRIRPPGVLLSAAIVIWSSSGTAPPACCASPREAGPGAWKSHNTPRATRAPEVHASKPVLARFPYDWDKSTKRRNTNLKSYFQMRIFEKQKTTPAFLQGRTSDRWFLGYEQRRLHPGRRRTNDRIDEWDSENVTHEGRDSKIYNCD
jgi:hypothetical protein